MAQKIIVKNPKTHLIVTPASKAYFNLKNTGGPRGLQGVKGDPGTAATITAGTATTLPAGSSPTVSNSGSSSAAVFNFGIPKGDKGDKGDTGTPGSAATISVGTTTTGDAGTSASVTNSGTSSAAVFNFTIPRGVAGQDGADGEDGESATITVGTTTTLPAGSSATVTNTGTSSAAVLNFGIPKGEKGDSGSGAGDMSMSDYDPNGTVKSAGGIVAYVADETPTKTSDLTNDGSDGTSTYIEADDLATVATTGAYSDLTGTPTIPAAQVNSDWNAASGVAQILNKPTIPAAQVNSDWNANSGVAEILNKPTIPTVNDATLTVTQNGSTAGTFTANASSNTTIALTDTTYSTMAGATSSVAGASGLVPAPAAGDNEKYLKGDGTWDTGGGGVNLIMTTTDPGEGSALAADTLVGVYGGVGVTMDYSTTEQATGYTWIDGSMIYKKTVNFGTLPNATSKSMAHGISNLNMVLNVEATAKESSGVQIMLPFTNDVAVTNQVWIRTDSTNIVIGAGTNRSSFSAYVTLYYTKSV